jgi:CDGSH-type Zn-finger protein/uncharacterized Fe-S cluster protein YjdI
MTEKRSGDRRYTGTNIDITYNLRRCIHAEHCIHSLGRVFDKDARPWINANGATADEVTEAVLGCPSGALHFERKDGGLAEAIPETNTVIVWRNGPLQFIGDLHVGDTIVETRATLCRCGASRNKPFCDNTHKEVGFSAHEKPSSQMSVEALNGTLTVTPSLNGPLQIKGNLEIRDEAGNVLFRGTETELCRCGGSGRKPFCDGTHEVIGFKAE